jgi:hypothetical protein
VWRQFTCETRCGSRTTAKQSVEVGADTRATVAPRTIRRVVASGGSSTADSGSGVAASFTSLNRDWQRPQPDGRPLRVGRVVRLENVLGHLSSAARHAVHRRGSATVRAAAAARTRGIVPAGEVQIGGGTRRHKTPVVGQSLCWKEPRTAANRVSADLDRSGTDGSQALGQEKLDR